MAVNRAWRRKRIELYHRNRSRKLKSKAIVSNYEQRIKRFVDEVFPNEMVLHNDRKVLDGYELDIYLPNLKLAFEVNGIQHYKFFKKFHKKRTDFLKQKGRDAYKKALCRKLGINLVVLPIFMGFEANTQTIKDVHSLLNSSSQSVNHQALKQGEPLAKQKDEANMNLEHPVSYPI